MVARCSALIGLQQRGVGDFQFEPARRQAGIDQRGQDEIEQVSAGELSGGNVDGNPDIGRPGGGIQAGLPQDPVAERQHQGARFREPEEPVGRQKAFRRMMPAHECLDAADAAGPCIDDRLIMQFEFVAHDRVAQLAFHRALDVGGLGQFGLEYPEGVSPARLRRIEREIGVVQQRLGIVAMLRRERNADAGSDVDLMTAEIERPLDRPDDPQRERDGALDLDLLLLLDDGEFIAAQTGQHVDIADRRRAAAAPLRPATGRRPHVPACR